MGSTRGHVNDGCTALPYGIDLSQHNALIVAPKSYVDDDEDDDNEAYAGEIYNNRLSADDDDDCLLSEATRRGHFV